MAALFNTYSLIYALKTKLRNTTSLPPPPPNTHRVGLYRKSREKSKVGSRLSRPGSRGRWSQRFQLEKKARVLTPLMVALGAFSEIRSFAGKLRPRRAGFSASWNLLEWGPGSCCRRREQPFCARREGEPGPS